MQLIASENDTVLGIALFQSPVLLFVIITFTRQRIVAFTGINKRIYVF